MWGWQYAVCAPVGYSYIVVVVVVVVVICGVLIHVCCASVRGACDGVVVLISRCSVLLTYCTEWLMHCVSLLRVMSRNQRRIYTWVKCECYWNFWDFVWNKYIHIHSYTVGQKTGPFCKFIDLWIAFSRHRIQKVYDGVKRRSMFSTLRGQSITYSNVGVFSHG